MTSSYPAGTVGHLIAGEHVAAPTRAALEVRLAERFTAPRWFDAAEFTTLTALCARLAPPGSHATVDVAGAIDARLADGRGNGWRYAALPPDGEAYRQALAQLGDFAALDLATQDAAIATLQRRSPQLFEELLAEVAETFYSHPLAQEEIGYAGMADLPGWSRIGLDQREDREPVPDA